MKNWFNNLDQKKKSTLSISFSIIGFIFILIGFSNYYFIIIGAPLLLLGLIFADWNKNNSKSTNESESENNINFLKYKPLTNNNSDISSVQEIDNKELLKYKGLLSNNFDISAVQCNFECSLHIMVLKQIKENRNFNPADLDFDIDEKISQLTEKGRNYFLDSKFKSFVALDIETTGLDKELDRIIQISIVKVINGEINKIYTNFINPKKHISIRASEVNGIYDEDVKNEKTIKELFPEILNFIDNLPIVAHNAQFDLGFLRNEYIRNIDENFPKHKDICTMNLWRTLYTNFQDEKPQSSTLYTLVLNLLDDEDIKYYEKNRHNASCDAIVTAKVFMKMYDSNYIKIIKNKNKTKTNI